VNKLGGDQNSNPEPLTISWTTTPHFWVQHNSPLYC